MPDKCRADDLGWRHGVFERPTVPRDLAGVWLLRMLGDGTRRFSDTHTAQAITMFVMRHLTRSDWGTTNDRNRHRESA